MASANSVLYYLTLDRNTTWNESKKKKKRKKKKKSTSKRDETIGEEVQNEQYTTSQLDVKASTTTETHEEMIHIWIICEPVANFDMKVTSSRTIEEMMEDIEKRVWDLKQTRINVMRLQL